MPKPEGFTDEQWLAHVRNLATPHCKNKHPDYFESLICIGPGSERFGPPCDGCVEEKRLELEAKQRKAHGVEVSPKEAAELRKHFGGDDLISDN